MSTSPEPPVRKVERVDFGIMSAEEIRQISECELYMTNEGPNSIYDDRMGNLGVECGTCGDSARGTQCPGHFGRIELNVPIIHPQFYSVIIKVLKVVCFECSSLLLTEEALQIHNIDSTELITHLNSSSINEFLRTTRVTSEYMSDFNDMLGVRRLKEIESKLIKSDKAIIMCPVCEHLQPKYVEQRKGGDVCIRAYYDPDDPFTLSSTKIHDILSTMDDRTVELIGFSHNNHPMNMILTVLPVLPTVSRPYVILKDGEKGDDDISHVIRDIIKHNVQYKNETRDKKAKVEIERMLNQEIAMLFDNSTGRPIQFTTSRSFKGFRQRFDTKQGLMRKNCMGKRVDFSARTVISPDPNLKIDEIGVPFDAEFKRMTVPIRLTDHNIDYVVHELAKFKHNPFYREGWKGIRGDEKIMDAVSVTRDGSTRLLKIILQRDPHFKFRIGDVIERRLADGDRVMFGRQPSLWKHSMMGFKVKFLPGKTFRLSPVNCTPFNGDFDGDEMNMHVAQGPQAISEVDTVANVKNNILCCQSSKNVIGAIQDTVTGVYLLTQPDTMVSKSDFFDSAFVANVDQAVYPNFKRWNSLTKKSFPEFLTGRMLFSLLLPQDFSYSSDGPDGHVKIKYGLLLSGTLAKKHIGTVHRSLIHILHEHYSSDTAVKFVENLQAMIMCWLPRRGFSVGKEDCVVTDTDSIHNVVTRAEMEVSAIEESNDPYAEPRVMQALGKAKDIGQRMAKESLAVHADNRNSLKDMVTAGSKGNYINVTQIGGLLGQQVLDGHRVLPEFGYAGRTLPHFDKNDISPEAKGFIKSSFLHGLSPTEMFLHSKSGREGIINTAVSTQSTGYDSRKMIKAAEDLVVAHDGTVRCVNGSVLQFKYGDDGMQTSSMIGVNGVSQFVDVKQLAKQINNQFEIDNGLVHVRG
jgi:DNA-directed RNA polymerase II subunit RPB1